MKVAIVTRLLAEWDVDVYTAHFLVLSVQCSVSYLTLSTIFLLVLRFVLQKHPNPNNFSRQPLFRN